ncbi:hypothetical protein GCM10009605_32770 [Nocardiopsis composta]
MLGEGEAEGGTLVGSSESGEAEGSAEADAPAGPSSDADGRHA